MTVLDPALVLADMLCAAADDLGLKLTRRDANRLAAATVELLAVAGYTIVREDR